MDLCSRVMVYMSALFEKAFEALISLTEKSVWWRGKRAAVRGQQRFEAVVLIPHEVKVASEANYC